MQLIVKTIYTHSNGSANKPFVVQNVSEKMPPFSIRHSLKTQSDKTPRTQDTPDSDSLRSSSI